MKRHRARPGLLRLLIVDDDPVHQKAVGALARGLGHQVAAASDGREALAALEAKRFDAILMDLHMPNLDGIATTLEVFRRFAAERRPLVIAMVGSEGPGDVPRFLAAGARACLRKPVSSEELATLLEAMRPAR
ncbi:MAG TPA: response regulator [Nevskiaceae bacterium]|nr:response regulator [Nevskiaceae bacterium]